MRISDWSSDVCSSDLSRGTASRGHLAPGSGAIAPSPGHLPFQIAARGEWPRALRKVRAMTKKNKNGAAMPLIRMIDSEADALTELTLQQQRDSISFYELLLDEIDRAAICERPDIRSEEHTSELQSLMRISYAVFCLKKKK